MMGIGLWVCGNGRWPHLEAMSIELPKWQLQQPPQVFDTNLDDAKVQGMEIRHAPRCVRQCILYLDGRLGEQFLATCSRC